MTDAGVDAGVGVAGDPAPASTVEPLVWLNGVAADPAAPHISALDRGFTLADGLFETVRLYHGLPFRLGRHLARLAHGAAALDIALPESLPEQVETAVRGARAAWTVERGGEGNRAYDAAMRITITRGSGGRGVAPPVVGTPTVAIAIHPLSASPASPPDESPPLLARTARARRNEHAAAAGIKTLAYVEAVLALAEARAAGVDDAIFLDTAGHVSEGTSSNVFAVRHGALVTPPRSCGVLPGITREAVLELAGTLGLPAAERELSPADVAAADELFLTSSIREIAPVVVLDGHAIGTGHVGAITRRVREAFRALVASECAP